MRAHWLLLAVALTLLLPLAALLATRRRSRRHSAGEAGRDRRVLRNHGLRRSSSVCERDGHGRGSLRRGRDGGTAVARVASCIAVVSGVDTGILHLQVSRLLLGNVLREGIRRCSGELARRLCAFRQRGVSREGAAQRPLLRRRWRLRVATAWQGRAMRRTAGDSAGDHGR